MLISCSSQWLHVGRSSVDLVHLSMLHSCSFPSSTLSFYWSSRWLKYFCLAESHDNCSCLFWTSTFNIQPTTCMWSHIIRFAAKVVSSKIFYCIVFVLRKATFDWCLSTGQYENPFNNFPQLGERFIIGHCVMEQNVNSVSVTLKRWLELSSCLLQPLHQKVPHFATEIVRFHKLSKIPRLSSTYGIKFKNFQAPALFSSTFKALNLGKKFSTFHNFQRSTGTQTNRHQRVKKLQASSGEKYLEWKIRKRSVDIKRRVKYWDWTECIDGLQPQVQVLTSTEPHHASKRQVSSLNNHLIGL